MQPDFRQLQTNLFVILLTVMIGCKSRISPKENISSGGTNDTLGNVAAQLVGKYPNGQVSLCIHEQDTFYFGQRNAPDAGGELYDLRGTQVGTCYFNTAQVHPYCRFEWDCRTLYRSTPNIWGLPEVKFTFEK